MDERGIPQWLWFEQIEEEGKTVALGSSGRAQSSQKSIGKLRTPAQQADRQILGLTMTVLLTVLSRAFSIQQTRGRRGAKFGRNGVADSHQAPPLAEGSGWPGAE
jgi:hypothetical protein